MAFCVYVWSYGSEFSVVDHIYVMMCSWYKSTHVITCMHGSFPDAIVSSLLRLGTRAMEASENATRKRRFGTIITPNVEQLAASKRAKQSALSSSCNFTTWSKEEVASFLQRNNFPSTTVQTFTGETRLLCSTL